MIDHVTFAASDYERSLAFYDAALGGLGLKRIFERSTDAGRVTGYGDTRPWFWIADARPTSGTLHLALTAESRDAVDAFHREGIGAGGTNNGDPGYRPHYHPGYYAAFVRDPDGHNIEAVFRDPAGR